MIELKQLGVDISEEQIAGEKRAEESKGINKAIAKNRNQERKTEEDLADSDEYFNFIAGYTSGGVPYGITWDEDDELLSQ